VAHLQALGGFDRARVAQIAGVQGRGGLEQQHVGLGVRDGLVLDPLRNDEEKSASFSARLTFCTQGRR
jgi:hypothetical protein